MSPYLDQILGIYAPDVPGVREALTSIVEGEVAARLAPEQRATIQIAIVLAEAGSPHDGTVEGVRWLAEELAANRACNLSTWKERAARAEADAATLRSALVEIAHLHVYCCDRCGDEHEALARTALTSGGQG